MLEFQVVLSVLNQFISHLGTFAVAGGAVRDELLGLQFKDIDVVFIPNEKDHSVMTDLTNALEKVGIEDIYTTGNSTLPSEDLASYIGEDDFFERLYGVIKVIIAGKEVDILVQRKANSVEEAVKGFDHIMNLVFFDSHSKSIKHMLDDRDLEGLEHFKEWQDDPAQYLEERFHFNYGFLREVPSVRHEKMVEKVENYGQQFAKTIRELGE